MTQILSHNFLTEPELMRLGRYRPDEREKEREGEMKRLLTPLFMWMAKMCFPANVAPNVLALASLLCVLQAFYLCEMYSATYPSAVTFLSLVLVFANYLLHRLDHCHALNVRNESVLGDIFSDACGNIGAIFNALVLCRIMGMRDFASCWYIVQIVQLGLLRHHVTAFKKGYLHFPTLTGPDAAFVWFGLITLSNLIIDPIILDHVRTFLHVSSLLSLCYWTLLAYSAIEAATLPFSSRNGIIFCLIYRSIPGLLMYLGISQVSHWMDIFSDGLFMSMVTTDMIVGRKAGRDLHPWIVLFAMAAVVNNFISLFLVSFYFFSLFYDISQFLNLPLFTTVVNVYCDGIYDMCHLGHKMAFQNALQFGNRLFVGVVNDEDATPYKRKPIMTSDERCAAVAACKCVYAVIPNAPCDGIPEEFIRQHNIHIVAHGEEYEKPDDHYYAVPRKMGITRLLPRTQGMSTSELIRRVCKYNEDRLREEGKL